MRSRSRLAGIAAALLALSGVAAPACAEDAPGATVTGDTITFGQYADQSGANAAIGAARYGLDAYLQAANAQGGAHGKKLRLISYDDGYKPAQTAALVKKLVFEDGVFAIVGGVGSPTTAAVAPTLNDLGVPLIGMATGSPIFYDPTRKYVFPAWPLYTTDGKTMATFLKTHFAGKKVGIIYQDDSFGKPILAAVESVLGHVEEVPYSPGQVDFSSAVVKFKAAGVDALVLATIAAPAAQILNELPKFNYAPVRVLTGSACGYTTIFKTVPSLEGAYCAAFLPTPESKDPQWTAFEDAMARYEQGHPAEIYSAWGWLAGQVAVEGLRRIRGPITREAFVAALESIKSFHTIGGDLSYSAQSHRGIGGQFIWQAKNGRWLTVPNSKVEP
ncbi:MAG: branched-chain amino acid transporter substrate-binding protein [Candidatus Eremiobacteraeota bacterium]|nr:branched-chain amino acid transporter substrate-binding protein [Candidatus Eremiobacteraeota bacterium]